MLSARINFVSCLGRRSVAALLIGLVCGSGGWAAAAERPLEYNRDVRPILSDSCFACHGFDEHAREADLRLDVAEEAFADRGGYAAIVRGDAEASEVWRRITSDDEYEVMPPPDSHRVLSAEQKEILRRWIDEGANYQKHWSFIPPEKRQLPPVAAHDWPQGEIDHFVLARLEAEGWQPAREADRYTLIRRLALDLTGLPPSAEEVEAFVADERPDAYERLVERLLHRMYRVGRTHQSPPLGTLPCHAPPPDTGIWEPLPRRLPRCSWSGSWPPTC